MKKDQFLDKGVITPIQTATCASQLSDELDDWAKVLYQTIRLRKYNENETTHYGIERCLYELNPNLVCLSPYLISARAETPVEVLKALEFVAAQPNRPSFPIDRHVAAFLVSRWKEINLIDLSNLNKPQREVKNLAALRILAGIQNQYKVKNLQHLGQWMADLCTPIVTHYHNLKARSQAQQEIVKAVASGQLIKLVKILENRRDLSNDESDYQAARIEILLIESEIKEVASKITNRNQGDLRRAEGIVSQLHDMYCKAFIGVKSYKNKRRMRQLYKTSENLREAWGEGIAPTRKGQKHDFWKRLLGKTSA
jgi:hypothetical protein